MPRKKQRAPKRKLACTTSEAITGESLQEPETKLSKTERQLKKEEYEETIMTWLEENYELNADVYLSGFLIYQHYMRHCALQGLEIKTELLFKQIMIKKYPHLTKEKTARGKNCWYYKGLDIQKTSEEYESVAKGRKLQLFYVLKQDKNPGTLEETEVKESNQADVALCGTGTGPDLQSWASLSAQNKEQHRKLVFEWLDGDYEMSPNICLSRTAVYDHYVTHCKRENIYPAIQAMFGRMVFKKFPKTKMRRLGTRGNSRYYYMGIDIREESSHYAMVSTDRVVCSSGKTKLSSFHYKNHFNNPAVRTRAVVHDEA